jgi:hypothetical protein
MKDLATFLKSLQVETRTQNHLQLPLNSSKHLEILRDTLNMRLSHLLKLLALLMMITKSYHFEKKLRLKL